MRSRQNRRFQIPKRSAFASALFSCSQNRRVSISHRCEQNEWRNLRETLSENHSPCSVRRRFRSVDFPLPDGPQITSGREGDIECRLTVRYSEAREKRESLRERRQTRSSPSCILEQSILLGGYEIRTTLTEALSDSDQRELLRIGAAVPRQRGELSSKQKTSIKKFPRPRAQL